MDRENLRKELYEEIQSQFETKLREAKREKSQLEEEIESASEKWRAERRRLNAEIDRLETKLAETRETRRKAPDPKSAKAADPQEIAQIQAVADEKVKKAAQAFESEREKLQAEISRLQRGIADLIERSNNPLRANQLEKERYETRLEDALKAKRQTEDALLAAKANWEQEKLKLVAETVKLRRPAAEKPKSGRGDEFVQQLEMKLEETLRSRDKLTDELDRMKVQTRFKQEEFDALTLQLEQSKKERANLEKQLREISKSQGQPAVTQASSEELSTLKDQLDKSQKERANLERQLREMPKSQGQPGVTQASSEELSALKDQLDKSQKERANLERQLREMPKSQGQPAVTQASSEELSALKDQLDKSEKERANLERQVRESSRAQEKLERELDKVRQSPIVMKEAQSAEIERLKEELRSARAEVKQAGSQADEARATASKERAALEKQLRDTSAQQEKLARELDRLQQSTAGSPAQSESAQVARIKQEYQNAQAETRLAAAATKQQHAAEVAKLNEELAAARQRLQQLEAKPGANSDAVNSEIVEQLRQQYDERMQAMIQEKTQLSDELRTVTSTLEQERMKLAKSGANSANSNHNETNTEVVDAEVERIQEMIAGIAQLIDDPETELSTVIRKNVERAELDAYLKGILFSLGRGSGL
jgi:plectin